MIANKYEWGLNKLVPNSKMNTKETREQWALIASPIIPSPGCYIKVVPKYLPKHSTQFIRWSSTWNSTTWKWWTFPNIEATIRKQFIIGSSSDNHRQTVTNRTTYPRQICQLKECLSLGQNTQSRKERFLMISEQAQAQMSNGSTATIRGLDNRMKQQNGLARHFGVFDEFVQIRYIEVPPGKSCRRRGGLGCLDHPTWDFGCIYNRSRILESIYTDSKLCRHNCIRSNVG